MKQDRINAIYAAIERAQASAALAELPGWRDIWEGIESECLDRLLKLSDTDEDADERRRRLAVVINLSRQVRSLVEGKRATAKQLEAELDIIEGRRMAPVA